MYILKFIPMLQEKGWMKSMRIQDLTGMQTM